MIRGRGVHAVPVGVVLLVLAGCAGERSSQRTYRIWQDPQEQTIAFEPSDLPGNTFKIVIPEIITDKQETLLGWDQKVDAWTITADRAGWKAEIPGRIRMNAEVLFAGDHIAARVEMTNLSQRTWELANAFTCFAFHEAPLFYNPELDRMMFPMDGQWRKVADVFAERSPGLGPYTFFRVRGGPAVMDMMVCRRVKQSHPQVVDYGAGCVVSTDGCWVAGIRCEKPAYVFCNRRETCLHANPVYDPIAPGATASATSHIWILRGGVPEFERMDCDHEE